MKLSEKLISVTCNAEGLVCIGSSGDRAIFREVIDKLKEMEKSAEVKEEAENKILRKLLWLRHGCEGLYGDDGEMQCGKCRIDFKRDDIDKIYGIFEKAALNKLLNNGKLIKKGE